MAINTIFGNEMNCTRWRDMASDYVEGTLDTNTASAVRVHLTTCAACRADEQILRAIALGTATLPDVEPPLFFRDNVLTAIERQERRFWNVRQESSRSWGVWGNVLPRLSRVTVGTLATAGVVAAVAFTVLLPGGILRQARVAQSPFAIPLPGAGASPTVAEPTPAPRLRVARVTTLMPNDGAAYDFSLSLENAQQGTLRVSFVGDKKTYRFALDDNGPQTLRVPFSAAHNNTDSNTNGPNAIGLVLHWTANGGTHTKYLLVPVSLADGAESTKQAQSFALPEQTMVEAARELSARYNRPITLEDVPDTVRVAVAAHSETLTQTLRRSLAPYHLRVTESRAGVLVEPQQEQP